MVIEEGTSFSSNASLLVIIVIPSIFRFGIAFGRAPVARIMFLLINVVVELPSISNVLLSSREAWPLI